MSQGMEMTFISLNTNDGELPLVVNPPCRGYYTDVRIIISNDLKWQYFYMGTKDIDLIALPNVGGESQTLNIQEGIFIPLTIINQSDTGIKVITAFSKKKIYINSYLDKLKIYGGQTNNNVWVVVQATFVPKIGELLYAQRNFTWTSEVNLSLIQTIQFLENGKIHEVVARIVIPKSATAGVAVVRPYLVKREDLNFILHALTSGNSLGDLLVSDAQSDGQFHGHATGIEPFSFKVDVDEDTVYNFSLPYAGVKIERGDMIFIDIDKESGAFAAAEFFLTAKYEVTSTKGHQAVKTEYLKLNEENSGIHDLGLI